MGVWREPLINLRVPKIYNLRSDPFERGDEDASIFYNKWMIDRAFILIPAQAAVAVFLKTFEEFPPRQRPASFSIGNAVERAREKERALAGKQQPEVPHRFIVKLSSKQPYRECVLTADIGVEPDD